MSQLDQSQTVVPPYLRESVGNTVFPKSAQSFKPSQTAQLHSIEVALAKYNVTTSTSVRMKIYSDSGGEPNSLLATSNNTVSVSSISLSTEGSGYSLHTFSFTDGPSLTAETTYWYVLETLDELNYDEIIYTAGYWDSVDPYSRGVAKRYNGYVWSVIEGDTQLIYDMYFQEYYAESSESASPSLTPSSSVSLSPSPSVSPSSSPSSSPSEGSSPSLSPSLSPSITPSSSVSLSVSLSPSRSYSASISPSSSDSVSISPSPSPAFTCDLVQLTDETLNTNGITGANGGAWAYAQSFKPTSEYPIGKVQVSVKRDSTQITGSLRLLLMSTVLGLPSTILDTSNNTYTIDDFPLDEALHLDFHFDHNVFLDPDNTYAIVLDGVDIVAPMGGAILIQGSDALSAASDAYPDGKLMFTQAFDGIGDTWVDAAPGGEGILEWMDMYFKICYDPLAWSHSPSLSPSPSPSASTSPSLTPSSSVSASVSPSLSLSPSPSRSQYQDSYSIKSTVWSDKYKKW